MLQFCARAGHLKHMVTEVIYFFITFYIEVILEYW
jgi:hypothetical protein